MTLAEAIQIAGAALAEHGDLQYEGGHVHALDPDNRDQMDRAQAFNLLKCVGRGAPQASSK